MATLQELYDSLSPSGYYGLMAIVAFLIGLLLGWLLWWWKSRRLDELTSEQQRVEAEISRITSECSTLKRECQERATAKASFANGDDSDHNSVSHDERELANQPLSFASPSGPSVDWNQLEEIDPKVAEQLSVMGVKSVDQLESLSPENRKVLEARMSTAGVAWDWSSLGGWKTAAAGIAATGAAAAGIAATSGAVTTDSGDKNLASTPPIARSEAVAETAGTGQASSQVSASDESNASKSNASNSNASDSNASNKDNTSSPRSFGSDSGSTSWYKQSPLSSSANGGSSLETPPHVGKENDEIGAKLDTAQLGLASVVGGAATSPSDVDPAERVNWQATAGVDKELAAEMKDLGIHSVSQLENLSTEQRERLQSHMDAKGLKWNWGWLANWKTAAVAGAAGAAAISASSGSEEASNIEVASSTEATSKRAADPKNDSASKNEVASDNQAASDNEAASRDEAGSSNDAASRGEAGSRSDLSTGSGSTESSAGNSGTTPETASDSRSETGHSKSGWALPTHAGVDPPSTRDSATGSHAAANPASASDIGINLPSISGPTVNWSSTEGVAPEVATELDALGIKSVEQLESLSTPDRERLEANFRNKGIDWDWSKLGGWKTAAAAAGFGTAKVVGFASGHAGSHDSSSAGNTTQPLSQITDNSPDTGHMSSNYDSSQLPVFAQGVPAVKDDLTLLDGIDGDQANELHRMGIHNFDQLHDLSGEQRRQLQDWFHKRDWHLDMDQWRIASEGNTLSPTTEDIQNKAYEVYLFRDREGLNGWERTDWDQAEWELRGNPSFGYGVPHDVDDFAADVSGITPEARDELYRMGLYNRHQIQNLDRDARRLLTRWFAGPRFKVDLTMAFGWLSSLQTVPQDKNYGFVFQGPPERIDDLSDINGVGPATERDLNRIGIFHFYQIACWSDENVDAISETLDLGGRITEDSWIVQAKRLADEVNHG